MGRNTEIQNALLLDQMADDGPELCDRVFRMKLKLLLKHLKEQKPFGQITAFVSVIEFQKRGFVHTHIIIFLDQGARFSLQDPTIIDTLISAEIPPVTSPHLRELVLKHMIHDPCNANPTDRCISEERCSKNFPKPIRSETASVEGDYYVSYGGEALQRGEFQDRARKIKVTGTTMIILDNS